MQTLQGEGHRASICQEVQVAKILVSTFAKELFWLQDAEVN